MENLTIGSTGAEVRLLQATLTRAGYAPGPLDGRYGPATYRAVLAFQEKTGLAPDGIAGPLTRQALMPWALGYVRRAVRPGDSFWRLAREYNTGVAAIETANPGADPLNLRPGILLTIPLGFPLTALPLAWSWQAVTDVLRGLAARYPCFTLDSIGQSVRGRELWQLRFGHGGHRVLYTAAHHANESITAGVLLRFAEELGQTWAADGALAGAEIRTLEDSTTLCLIPAVNPDGMDLVNGVLADGPDYAAARAIAADYPAIPFPAGWKANLRGTDLNLQYPAGWQQAREIKFAQGYTGPAPRDYVGSAPLSAPESFALYSRTRQFDPALVLAYHTQGQVIYWRYLDFDPPGAEALGRELAALSGYALEDTPYASGFAGYKDWFIQTYNRPGFTIECGLGENPLPPEALDGIYAKNRALLVRAALPG